MTEWSQSESEFKGHFSRRAGAAFDGGALLLRETDRRLNLLPRPAECFLDRRTAFGSSQQKAPGGPNRGADGGDDQKPRPGLHTHQGCILSRCRPDGPDARSRPGHHGYRSEASVTAPVRTGTVTRATSGPVRAISRSVLDLDRPAP